MHAYGGLPIQYDRVRRGAKVDRGRTPGVVSQMGGPTEDGWCLTTVFQREDAAHEYSQGQLARAFADADVSMDHVEIEVVPVLDVDDE